MQPERLDRLGSNIKGRTSELRAAQKLLEHGYSVAEPVLHIEPYDLVARDMETGETFFIQVKTLQTRSSKKHGGTWDYIEGRYGGRTYPKTVVDKFIAVDGDDAYMFDNKEQTEYWVRPDEKHIKWKKL